MKTGQKKTMQLINVEREKRKKKGGERGKYDKKNLTKVLQHMKKRECVNIFILDEIWWY